MILFTDGEQESINQEEGTKEYLKENNDLIKIFYLPKGSPEFNAVEECWRQGKFDLLVSKYYPGFADLKLSIAKYYRTRRFNLDIVKFLQRKTN